MLLLTAAFCALALTFGCSDDRDETQETTTRPEADAPTKTSPRTTPPEIPEPPQPVRGYTYGDATGNRVVEGEGRLPGARSIDVPLSGTPLWVLGTPLEEDIGWTVAYGDGRVDAFRLDTESGRVEDWLTAPAELPPGAPPAVVVEGERMRLLDGGSALTHPVDTGAGVLTIGPNGDLPMAPEEAPLKGVPDARIVENPDGDLALLSGPTSRYDHGVLGDDLEAESITVLRDSDDGFEASVTLTPESGGVFEALSPLWFEVEGEDLLAVTESAEGVGSRISVYDPDGTLVAAGPFIGEPKKWRHLMAVGPFGPGGEIELAVTRTPHADATTEFYRLDRKAKELRLSATGAGFPSHTLYSRNLDTARAGDLDGDSAWELLVPDESYTGLVALRHGRGGVEEAWRLPLGGNLSTNIGGATGADGRMAVAAGTTDGVLRIWR